MPTATLTGTAIETYSGHVMHAYHLGDIFNSRNMIYHGVEDTEVINQPLVTPGTIRFKDDDTTHAENDASMISSEIKLEVPIKQQNNVMYRSVNERPSLGLLANFGVAHGRTIGEGKTISLLNFLAKIANTNSNIVSVNGTSGSAIQAGVNDILASMDEQKVFGMGRRGIMRPTQFYKFATQEGVIRKDFGGAGNIRTLGGNGATLEYGNTDIVNAGLAFGTDWTASAHSGIAFPTKFAFDMSQVIGVFWQLDSWALREQEQPHSTIDTIPESQVWQVLSRMQLGAQEIQTDGIWILTDTNTGP